MKASSTVSVQISLNTEHGVTVNNDLRAAHDHHSFSTMTFDAERYDELRFLLETYGYVTLGGGETLSELQEMAEEIFGDEV